MPCALAARADAVGACNVCFWPEADIASDHSEQQSAPLEVGLKLRELAHGTRTTVLLFEGAADTSLSTWYAALVGMMDALERSPDFKNSNDRYRRDTSEFVVKGVDFEWSNGVAAIWSDIPHEIIIVFDGTLRPRKAEALVEALMTVWDDIPSC